MLKLATAFVKNSLRAAFGDGTWFEPMLPTLYVTPMCNLRCDYCEDFGAQRNEEYRNAVLPLEKMLRLVEILAEACDLLYVTGGEPTMRTDLVQILAHAKRRGIHYLAMNTNALLLQDHEAILEHLDNLVISVDSLAAGRWDSTLVGQPKQVSRLLENVRWAATLQKQRGFTLTVTCVVTPGRVGAARQVRDFCYSIGAHFSAQHLSHNRIPVPELRQDPEFLQFIDELIEGKRRGEPISGSELYLSGIKTAAPWGCTPTAAPHVDWLGRLGFPCRQLPDHVLVDVIEAGSIEAAQAEGRRRYGAAPSDCTRCGERCYVEISKLVRTPSAAARELFGYWLQARRAQRTTTV
jgi:MoaA/NifB/PqqE/SkfB family radical SAM enzyme